MNEINYENTNELVCPYCGYIESDSWSYLTKDLSAIYCKNCSKPFSAEREVTTTYTSTPYFSQDAQENCEGCEHEGFSVSVDGCPNSYFCKITRYQIFREERGAKRHVFCPYSSLITIEAEENISVETIQKGIKQNVIRIINNPNDDCISAQIGDYWFYFDESEEEGMKAEDYLDHVSVEDASLMISEAINSDPIKGPTFEESTEWFYYKAILREKIA